MTLGTADRVAPGDLKITSKHILYVHGQSTGTGRAEFSWLPPLLLVFVSSVALVGVESLRWGQWGGIGNVSLALG